MAKSIEIGTWVNYVGSLTGHHGRYQVLSYSRGSYTLKHPMGFFRLSGVRRESINLSAPLEVTS